MISSPWLSVNVAGPFKASEVQSSVAVATPYHHGDGEAEHGGERCPGNGEQHDLTSSMGGSYLGSTTNFLRLKQLS